MSNLRDLRVPFLQLSFEQRQSLVIHYRKMRKVTVEKPAPIQRKIRKKQTVIDLLDNLTPEQAQKLAHALKGR